MREGDAESSAKNVYEDGRNEALKKTDCEQNVDVGLKTTDALKTSGN